MIFIINLIFIKNQAFNRSCSGFDSGFPCSFSQNSLASPKNRRISLTMNPFVKSLLSAREALIAELSQQLAQAQQQVGQLDALLSQYGVATATLPGLGSAVAAPVKRRGRPAGSTKKAKAVVESAPESAVAPEAAPRKKGKRGGKRSFNTTRAVRDIVQDMKKPFSVGDVREEFEKRHPGMLASINRVALSLALQSLGRRGEITAKKNPDGKGNLFQKAK
jgi:hypothetical protein